MVPSCRVGKSPAPRSRASYHRTLFRASAGGLLGGCEGGILHSVISVFDIVNLSGWRSGSALPSRTLEVIQNAYESDAKLDR